MSCLHLNINPNIKLMLSYWSTFKFGLILTHWHARKTWFFFKLELECELINILTPLYTWNWGCPWRPWQSEFFIIFSPQCACGSTFTLGTFRNVVALCKGKKSWMSLTPPRSSEISMKNWRAKVKPVFTPHLCYKFMLKVWRKLWESFRIYQLSSTAKCQCGHNWMNWAGLAVLVSWWILKGSHDFLHAFSMALYHKWVWKLTSPLPPIFHAYFRWSSRWCEVCMYSVYKVHAVHVFITTA